MTTEYGIHVKTGEGTTVEVLKPGIDRRVTALEEALPNVEEAMPVPSSTTPGSPTETGSAGTSEEYARADHQHPVQDTVATALKANKLAEARKITIAAQTLSPDQQAAEVTFDGSGNVSFATTCSGNCSGTCSTTCTGTCSNACTDACTSCTGTCAGSCTNCSGCTGSCTSCTGTCTANCKSNCSDTCRWDCSASCSNN